MTDYSIPLIIAASTVWLGATAAATYFGNWVWGVGTFIGIPLAVGGFIFYAVSKVVRGPQG